MFIDASVTPATASRSTPRGPRERMPPKSFSDIWCTESEVHSIVRGEIGRHAALLGLNVPQGTFSTSCLAWHPTLIVLPRPSELLTQYTTLDRRNGFRRDAAGRRMPMHQAVRR